MFFGTFGFLGFKVGWLLRWASAGWLQTCPTRLTNSVTRGTQSKEEVGRSGKKEIEFGRGWGVWQMTWIQKQLILYCLGKIGCLESGCEKQCIEYEQMSHRQVSRWLKGVIRELGGIGI